jgi:hypothetical protein
VSRVYLALIIAFVGLGVYAWANDKVTGEGERTIYTVECVQGSWDGNRCAGRLVAAKRFRFRALKGHREVLFWTIGEQGPSGKYTDCVIQDGHNWLCKPDTDTSRTITHEMRHGHPVPDSAVATLGFHQVAKWRWILLRVGLRAGSEATQ